MPSISSAHKKATKGTVVVESFKGRLRLRFRVAGERYCLAIGLPDLPKNREIAEDKANLIATDIKAGRFDPSLTKYQDPKAAKTSQGEPMLDNLWDKYTEFKRKQIETPSTLKRYSRFHKYVLSSADVAPDPRALSSSNETVNWSPETTRRVLSGIIESTSSIAGYQRFRSYLESLPSKKLGDAIEIQKHIRVTQPTGEAKHILTQIDICCEWATRVGLLSSNPFRQFVDDEADDLVIEDIESTNVSV
jgi:Arm DNA-binding domain